MCFGVCLCVCLLRDVRGDHYYVYTSKPYDVQIGPVLFLMSKCMFSFNIVILSQCFIFYKQPHLPDMNVNSHCALF